MPTPKSGPAGIAAARDGSIWFTEHAADQIAIFVPPGADRPAPGTHGFKEFALPRGGGPAGIVAAADGSLWFAENSGNRIGRITLAQNAEAAVITEYPLPVPHSHPNGVAIGGDGNVYFTELAASRIGRITPQGQISEMVLPVAGPALDIVAGSDGIIWMTVPKAHAICRLASRHSDNRLLFARNGHPGLHHRRHRWQSVFHRADRKDRPLHADWRDDRVRARGLARFRALRHRWQRCSCAAARDCSGYEDLRYKRIQFLSKTKSRNSDG